MNDWKPTEEMIAAVKQVLRHGIFKTNEEDSDTAWATAIIIAVQPFIAAQERERCANGWVTLLPKSAQWEIRSHDQSRR